jgi:aryl-alcohol dehydrogenase-like predicted oxidoreductase
MTYTRVAQTGGWTRLVSTQNHDNLVYGRRSGRCSRLDQGVDVIPWSPLARGRVPAGCAVAGGDGRRLSLRPPGAPGSARSS